ncbi:MAG: hypothetical protein WCP68_12425 [Enhydrobacter sp.]
MQLLGNERDGRTAHGEHLGHEVVRKLQHIVCDAIAYLDDPSAHAPLGRVQRIAGRGLLHLRHRELVAEEDDLEEDVAPGHGGLVVGGADPIA